MGPITALKHVIKLIVGHSCMLFYKYYHPYIMLIMYSKYSKGLLVRGFSWFVANPFIFNRLLGENDNNTIIPPSIYI